MFSKIFPCRYFSILLLFFLDSSCFGQGYNDLVISEIMADPTPAAGLPEVEYLELYNRSGQPIVLKNWKLMLGTRSAVFPDVIIEPDEYAVVCNKASEETMAVFGKIIPLSIFSLPNEGSTLALLRSDGQLIFSVTYEASWWPADQREGGHSIEMTDSSNPCGAENNWQVSQDERGGTPAKENSVKGSNSDTKPPIAERITVESTVELKLYASERLDSLNAVTGAAIELTGRQILKRKLESPQFRTLVLLLDTPLQSGEVYHLVIRNLSDCAGNLLREAGFSVALPVSADSGDVVLNEILFNPPEGGVDFVEIYNRSAKYIDLKNWSLGNVRNGIPDVLRGISTDHFILAPNQYLALTIAPDLVKQFYPVGKPGNFLRVASMPAFSNAAGGVVLVNGQQQLYDRFDYHEDLHDPLIQDRKGVSLEKADAGLPSGVLSNWHSASYTTGNATPGYANSQIKTEAEKDKFEVEPEAFVPGSVHDAARISYTLSQTGKIATVRIFDIQGRLVRNLLANQLIGTVGEMLWDGRNENSEIVPTGYYLILIDLFDADGRTAQYKRKVVVVKN